MKAIEALTSRVSFARLQAPAPSEEELNLLFKAAARAADHGMLKPYRFLVVSGEDDLRALGSLYKEAAIIADDALTSSQLERIQGLPLRAPMVVIAIASCESHPKVPEIEQQLTTAAAVQNMINAAYALGIGAIWRTGAFAYDPRVKQKLGLENNEFIIGFVYLGQAATANRTLRPKDTEVNFSRWPN